MTTITTILNNLAEISLHALAGDGVETSQARGDIADLGRFIAC